ncbi:MAG TPA: hypothetical protein VF021_07610, partial [Longimicrobiales bacterium]
MAALLLLTASATLFAQRPDFAQQSAAPEPLRFEYVGPTNHGRVAAVAGFPGDTMTYYFGAASGGVWKTTDGGRTFAPIFDDQPAQAIGALAVAPSSRNVVWAGTGEAWAIRDADVMGDGVYKSVDAGRTWQHMGLRESGRVGRILIHPANPEIVYVCALGRATGPQQERGVYKTTDGGRTWQRTLFVNPNTGCSGLSMDANDPNVLYAGTWEVVMHTWAMFSGGAGSGVYKSTDGGNSWKRLAAAGLPKSPVGKIDVAVAPSDSKRVYALIQTADQGSLWRSDDAGASWNVVSWDRRLIGRAGYYIHVMVNPRNPDEVHVMNSSSHRSTDGGRTFTEQVGGCGDCHDEWWDPTNPDHYSTTGDGGAGITRDHGRTWARVALPIGQQYHVAVDNEVPYRILTNAQDCCTQIGPSTGTFVPNVPAYNDSTSFVRVRRVRFGRGFGGFAANAPVSPPQWTRAGGCESGFTLAVPSNPDVIWATCYGSQVTRFDGRTGVTRSVSPWIHTLDSEPTRTKYRCHWTPPMAIDPFEAETVYYGCQVIFRTTDQGQTWSVISPDLSTQDPSRIVSSGGVIGDNLGQFYGEVVFAIAPSPVQRGLIWAGTNDGKVWYTQDGGSNWVDVTRNVKMPVWGTIRRIEPSAFDANVAYVAVDYHMMDDRAPYIYKTTDMGRTWTKITNGLPSNHPLAYVLTVAENPNRRGMLFAGTGNGFYYSMDDGANWQKLNEGLPAAPVTWVAPHKLTHDVVVSTYGRGIFTLRDITRLEQDAAKLTAYNGGADAFLYQPKSGVREARGGSAEFLYDLKSAPAAPIEFQITDASGTLIRKLEARRPRAGLNTLTWDLRYDGPKQVALRTTPPDNPHLWEEARFKGKDTHPIIHWGIQGPQTQGVTALPGRYEVRMIVNGKPYARTFDVVKDPAVAASDADLAKSLETQLRIVADMNQTVDMINRLEVIGRQIEDQLKSQTTDANSARELRSLEQKRMAVLLQLLSRTDLHSDDKWYVEAYKLYMNLVWLYGEVGPGAGDVAGGMDSKP